jgi:heat shock protein HslJ
MTIRTRMLGLATLALVALSVTGCAYTTDTGTRSAVDPEQLIGTWAIDETFDAPEQPFIDFADDGTWTSSDGCNRVQGTWELGDEGALTTTSGPSTLMACEGAQLPLAVALADYVIVSGDSLQIFSSAESTVTDLIRTDDPAIGPQGLPIGLWSESSETDAPFLSIAADGSFTGSDGCNSLFGSWELADDGAVLFSDVASTRKFCEGVDTWLSLAAKGRVLSGVMSIEDATGLVLGELSAQ